MTETYLGDGLYASFDGFQVVLRAPRYSGDAIVYLEPEVVTNFLDFIKRIKDENLSANSGPL